MSKLVLIRHGQSEWNLSNQFTGWVDVNLSEKGGNGGGTISGSGDPIGDILEDY